MLVALKPKPMLPGAADAGAASRSTAASTAGTSAMTLIFIFQVLPCCHRELVADTAETQRLLRPPSQLLNISSTSICPDGQENADASGPSGGWDGGPIGRSDVSTLRCGGGPGIGRCTNAASPGNPISCRRPS